jgi:type IV secretory pathway VirB2 component (pilin)
MQWLQIVARAAAGSSSPGSSSRLRQQVCLAVRGSLSGVVLVVALVVLGVVGVGSQAVDDLGLL